MSQRVHISPPAITLAGRLSVIIEALSPSCNLHTVLLIASCILHFVIGGAVSISRRPR